VTTTSEPPRACWRLWRERLHAARMQSRLITRSAFFPPITCGTRCDPVPDRLLIILMRFDVARFRPRGHRAPSAYLRPDRVEPGGVDANAASGYVCPVNDAAEPLVVGVRAGRADPGRACVPTVTLS
jgi:hypothetical protein